MKNQKIINCLKTLAEQHGGNLLPEIVVDAARPKTSPIHDKFTWDNGEAAIQYRLWQARQLISVCVEVVPNTGEEMPVFVSVSTDRHAGNGYRFLGHVMSEPELRSQTLKDALHELSILQSKYKRLKELAAVWNVVQKVKRKVA